MQTIEDNGPKSRSKSLNRFIANTYTIINSDEPTACWVTGGKSFLILDPKQFSQTVLPKYFNHSKFTSFVRQLNFYGFNKVRIDSSTLIASDTKLTKFRNMVCFQHKFFQASQPKLLQRIHRISSQSAATSVFESPSLIQEKEIERIQNQLRDTKTNMSSMRDEFEIKLATAKAELEIDYLHRIKAIEVCYKDLILMILCNKESTEFPLSSREENRLVSSPIITGIFPPVSRSSNIMSGKNYVSRDYLVERKLDLLSTPYHYNGGRRGLFDDADAKPQNINFDKPTGSSPHRLGYNGARCNKINDGTAVRTNLIEFLLKEKQTK